MRFVTAAVRGAAWTATGSAGTEPNAAFQPALPWARHPCFVQVSCHQPPSIFQHSLFSGKNRAFGFVFKPLAPARLRQTGGTLQICS